jgi:Fur family ferric uptake transcriptional regulator
MTGEPSDARATIGSMAKGAGGGWATHALEALQRAGYQRGGARQTVIEALARRDCAITALELEHDLSASGAAVGRATIYRVLEQLEELHLVHRLEIDKDRASFERAEPDGEHHHHLVCERCGRVAPFADTALERAIGRVSRGAGFEVRAHDVVLRGLCARCS